MIKIFVGKIRRSDLAMQTDIKYLLDVISAGRQDGSRCQRAGEGAPI